MEPRFVYLVRVDVAHAREPLLNEVYDTDHIPTLLRVPGVLRVSRYRTAAASEPRYQTMYELTKPEVLESKEWQAAVDVGRWAPEVRPHILNRHLVMYQSDQGDYDFSYTTPALHCEFLDVEGERDEHFRQVCAGTIPLLKQVPGVQRVGLFVAVRDGKPSRLIISEMQREDVVMSDDWRRATKDGRWLDDIEPWIHNWHKVMYTRAPSFKR